MSVGELRVAISIIVGGFVGLLFSEADDPISVLIGIGLALGLSVAACKIVEAILGV